MLGAFVSGMFEGAKSTFELMEMRNKMEVQNRKMQLGREQEERERAGINKPPTVTATPGAASTEPQPSTGTSTPPAPKVEPTPTVGGPGTPQGGQAGDITQWDKIHPYITKLESSNNPNAGWTPPGKPPVDLSKFPARPGYYGFPDWPGNEGPEGRSHAGGLFQIQPDLWKQYAPLANDGKGVDDFSIPSQYAVAKEIYRHEGLRPWIGQSASGRVFNEALRTELAKAGLIGGAGAAAARAGAGVSTLNAPGQAPAQMPGAAPPDLEGQRAAAKPATSPVVEQIVKPVVSALTPAPQQMPDGSAQFTPNPISPPTPNPIAPTRAAAPVTPADTAAAQSALTPAAAPAVSTTPVVTPPSPRNAMTQRQQYEAAIAAGERPAFPPNQRWNSRGEAVSQAVGRAQPQQRVTAPSSAVNQGFAAANKIIRLPDGTLVDAAGSVVQQPQSALFSR